mgnify:CR=1 FL=1
MSEPIARVIWTDDVNNVEQVAVGTHVFGFGGPAEGFCYLHQSFRCLGQLTPAERVALHTATEQEVET